jgi:hypothetical protein
MWKAMIGGVVLAIAGATAAAAQQAPDKAVLDAAAKAALDAAAAQKREAATQKFGGIEFGVGISLTTDLGARDRIGEASVAGGVVRVDDANNSNARVMLESHYFFKPEARFPGIDGEKMWGFGPFVALQPGTDEIIEAIALGAMIGFRRAEDTTESFNLGIGLVIDPNVRVLGDGIREGQPLPAGETMVRYKQTSQKGALFLASFGF